MNPPPALDARDLFHDGDGAGVALLHGLGGTPVEMRPVARAFARAGFAALCPRLSGHCGAEDDLKAARWEDWEAEAVAALERLRGRGRPTFIGGLSMGAVLALRVAASRPDLVDGLLLFAPTFVYDGWAMPWYRFLLKLLIDTPIGRNYSFMERHPFGLKDERIRARVVRAMTEGAASGDSGEAGLLGTPSQAVRQLWRLCDATTPSLPGIAAPAFLVHARDDDLASLANAERVMRTLGGRVEALILEDSYHLVTIDRQAPLAIARAIAFAQARVAELAVARRTAAA